MTAVSSVADVDAWIAQLSECKQLPESEIKKLCEKVLSVFFFEITLKQKNQKENIDQTIIGTRNSY